MTDEQLKAEIRTALNLGSLSNGLGEGFPCIERFEGICKAYAASQVAEIESRNAALVEALEEIRKPAMIISLGKATNRDRAEQLTEDHKRVRMIAQSALTTNTEKGGVNGEV